MRPRGKATVLHAEGRVVQRESGESSTRQIGVTQDPFKVETKPSCDLLKRLEQLRQALTMHAGISRAALRPARSDLTVISKRRERVISSSDLEGREATTNWSATGRDILTIDSIDRTPCSYFFASMNASMTSSAIRIRSLPVPGSFSTM
jgi:hypothetical protein